MKKLPTTKRGCLKLHREMWDWLAKNPGKKKGEWPGWIGDVEYVTHLCFLCYYAMDLKEAWCEECPAKDLWTKARRRDYTSNPCSDDDSPYRKWYMATDLGDERSAAKYAAQVRDIMKRRTS